MMSLIAGTFGDRRWVKHSLLAALIVVEILFGSLIAVRPGNSYLILGAAIGLIVVVATLIEPVLGLYVFVATTFTEASLLLGSVSATRLVGFLVLGAWIARSLSSRRFKIIVPAPSWFIALFMVWGLISAVWALDTRKLLTALLLLAQSLMLYILMINLLNSIQRVRIALAIIVAVSLGLATLTIVRVLRGDLVVGRADLSEVSVRDMNAQAAYFLPSATLLMMVLFSHSTRTSNKLILLLGWSVIALAVMATSSRGAIVSLVVILVLGIMVDHKLWKVVPPLVLIGGIATILLPDIFLDRLGSIVTFSDRGAGRADIWLVTLQMIQARPVLGVGLDSFGKGFDMYLSETPGIISEIGTGRGAHNVFLNVQGELGLIGSILFIALIGMTLKRGLVAIMDMRRAGDFDLASLATAVWLSLAGMLVMGLFMVVQYWKLFWLLLALPEVMRRLSAKATQKAVVQ